MKATGRKVAREEEDAPSRESSPTKAQPLVQAAGEWLEQALLQTSCLGDHIPCAVLAREVPKPTPAGLRSLTHLSRKVQLRRTFIRHTRQLLISALLETQTAASHFTSFKYWSLSPLQSVEWESKQEKKLRSKINSEEKETEN